MKPQGASRCFHCDGNLNKGGPTRLVTVELARKLIHSSCYEEWFRDTHPVVCPQCHGAGQIVISYVTEKVCCVTGETPRYGGHAGFAGCEYCPDIRENKEPGNVKTCELCNGEKRLAKEPTPITETKIVGWKK